MRRGFRVTRGRLVVKAAWALLGRHEVPAFGTCDVRAAGQPVGIPGREDQCDGGGEEGDGDQEDHQPVVLGLSQGCSVR